MASAPPPEDSILATCPRCSQIRYLEACIDCYQPLCQDCMKDHVDKWRQEATSYCEQTDLNVDNYLEKIRALNPLITQNKQNVDKVKAEIELLYSRFIEKLNNEKNQLLGTLARIESENELFENFEKDAVELKESLADFQNMAQASESRASFQQQLIKFNDCKGRVETIGNTYTTLKSKPFKIIGEFEKANSINLDVNFFGNLIVNESELLKYTSSAADKSKKDHNNVHMFGTLRVRLKKFAQMNDDYESSFKLPVYQYDIKVVPNHLASYRNHLFVIDETGNLTITELLANNELKPKSNYKLGIINVRAIAVCQFTSAISFADLTKDDMKLMSKKLKVKKLERKSGVIIFKWDNAYANCKLDKLVDLHKHEGLACPSGLALNESYLFVSDRQKHAILKIELKSGELVQHIVTSDSGPCSVCLLDRKFLAVTDALKHELVLYDADKLIKIKASKFNDEFQSLESTYDLAVSENESLIFVKNRSDTRIMVYDLGFNYRYSFEYELISNQGMTSLARPSTKNNYLVLGNTNSELKVSRLAVFTDF